MFCWLDLWEWIRKLEFIVIPIVVVGLVAFMLWSPVRLIRRRWLRITLRCIAAVPGTAIAIASPALVLGFLLASGDPPPSRRFVPSPDGETKARLEYQAGFLGRDGLTVTLGKAHSCHCEVAYQHFGPDDFSATDLIWVDSSHLQISYFADRDHIQTCHDTAENIRIECIVKPELSER